MAWNSESAAPPSFFHSPSSGPGHSLGARLSTDLGSGRNQGGNGLHLLARRVVHKSICSSSGASCSLGRSKSSPQLRSA